MTATVDQQHQETAGQLQDRVAFVTGGTRGIGEAIGRAMAQQGASIAAGYWRQERAGQEIPRHHDRGVPRPPHHPA